MAAGLPNIEDAILRFSACHRLSPTGLDNLINTLRRAMLGGTKTLRRDSP